MRIALVVYGSLDTVSGGYLYDRKLVAYLRAHGDEVDVVSLPWRNYASHLLDNASTGLSQRLRDGRFDVLLQDELNHPSLLRVNRQLAGGAARPRAPIVSIVHHLRASESHPAWVMPLYRRVERAYLRSCDAFVFNSATTRDSVAALAGTAAPHVIAYPAGDRFGAPVAAERVADGALRLIFVGNVTARKGLHTLIDALAQARCAWTLDVVGSETVEPAYAARMRARALTFGFRDKLRWHGRLDDAKLAGRYAAADALVVPSQYEGFGIVYLEAMGFGVPVIASSAGAAREIVTDGVDGLLVPPENAQVLAAAIERLAVPAQLAAMRVAARARFARHPGWDAACAQIREFLVTLTSGATPHAQTRA